MPGIHIIKDGVEDALGWRFDGIGIHHTVLLDRLKAKGARVSAAGQLTRHEIRLFARAMILLLIQKCFVARGGDEVSLHWLVLLMDFSVILTWD